MGDDGFLAIDAGSGSVKTFLVSPRGVIIRRYEINWDRETWAAETGWAMIVNSVKRLEIASSSINIRARSRREDP